MVEIDIEYEGDLHCKAVHGPSGAVICTDAPKDNQGRGEAFSPTDMVAAALGACIVTIMGIFARNRGIDLKGSRVHVTKEMVSEPVRRIGKISLTIDLPGHIEEGVRPALEKVIYTCPVHRSLSPEVKMDVTVRYGAPGAR